MHEAYLKQGFVKGHLKAICPAADVGLIVVLIE